MRKPIGNDDSTVVVSPTQLQRSPRLSELYGCNVFLKREDLQTVRSFKIRGAYNKIINGYHKHRDEQSKSGDGAKNLEVVTCSAGNHAQVG